MAVRTFLAEGVESEKVEPCVCPPGKRNGNPVPQRHLLEAKGRVLVVRRLESSKQSLRQRRCSAKHVLSNTVKSHSNTAWKKENDNSPATELKDMGHCNLVKTKFTRAVWKKFKRDKKTQKGRSKE